MLDKFLFRDRQEVQAADLNSIQDFAGSTFQALISDGVTDERKFTGFGVTASGETMIAVATGRLYSAGQVYGRGTDSTFDLFGSLPIATRRVVALVVTGQAEEAAVEARDFLIDLTSGATEPQAVAIQERQVANLAVLAGAESADPTAPTIGQNSLVVALVTLTTTGIESILAQVSNRLPNTKDNQRDIGGLQLWRGRVGPQIEAIQTNVAALEQKTDQKVDRKTMADLAGDIARVREKVGLPDVFSLSGSDIYQDVAETDEAAPGYAARIDQGVLFPFEASEVAGLDMFNPLDDKVIRSAGGWVLPKYTEEAKIAVLGYSGDKSVSQYALTSHVLKTHTFTKTYYRYGSYYGRARAWFGWNGYRNLYQYGRRYYGIYGWRYAHTETYSYQTLEPVETAINGTIISQSFLTPSAFWLSSIDLFFTSVGSSGDLTVAICETAYGKPDLDRVISQTTIPQADMQVYPTETRVEVAPTFMDAGRRYAIVLITEGSHRVAMAAGNSYTQGSFFYGNDGAYLAGALDTNLMFNANGAVFESPRTELMLGNVSLAGGISDLAIDTEMVEPDGTIVSFEVQVAGVWYPFETVDALGTTPDIVPVRAVFVGTRDIAPGFQLGAGRVTGSRADTSFLHVSSVRSLPGAATTTSISVVAYVAGYDDAVHTFSGRILSAANAEVATPDSVVVDTEIAEGIGKDAGGGVSRITLTFTTAAVDEYKIELSGTRIGNADPFRVIERTDVAI
jgi:hypothetical protein